MALGSFHSETYGLLDRKGRYPNENQDTDEKEGKVDSGQPQTANVFQHIRYPSKIWVICKFDE